MPPKKKKKNDFYFFMQEQKSVLSREGVTWHDMGHLAELCSSKWKQLDAQQRAPYKAKARAAKEQNQVDKAFVFDSLGRSVADIEHQREESEMNQRMMEKQIGEAIESAGKMGTLAKEKFYFIHFNTMLETHEGQFLPCELSACEFSLSRGVSRVLHTFVMPRDFPRGYSYEAKVQAAKTHKLDQMSEPLARTGASAYKFMARKLLQMLCPSGYDQACPPLYTLSDDARKTELLLHDLFSWAGVPLRPDLAIYHVDSLFRHMSLSLPAEKARLPSKAIASAMLTGEKYEYSANVACQFHESQDRCSYCSLHFVKKWAYIIADHCCAYLNIRLVPGAHQPPINDDDDDDYTSRNAHPKVIRITNEAMDDFDEAEPEPLTDSLGVKKTRSTPAGVGYVMPQTMELAVEVGVKSSLYQNSYEDYQNDDNFSPLGASASAQALAPAPFQSPWGRQTTHQLQDSAPPDVEDPDFFPSLGRASSRGTRGGRGSGRGRSRGQGGHGGGTRGAAGGSHLY